MNVLMISFYNISDLIMISLFGRKPQYKSRDIFNHFHLSNAHTSFHAI